MKKKSNVIKRMKKYWFLYVLAIIPMAYMVVFRLYPIVLQWRLALSDFTIKGGIWGSEFVGFENFEKLFTTREFTKLIRNTLRISVLRLVCGFFPPIILAILLFDMKSRKFKKFSQSILYIPHFFSWVIVYAMFQVLFQKTGYINEIIKLFGGTPKDFLIKIDYFLPMLIGSGIWKGIGWGTIIYLAALTNIDPQLFEAAKLDGAGPLQRIWYITLPGIRGIVVFQLLMSLGGILGNAGTEQILLFYGPANYEVSDVIGTWVYRQGLGDLQYSLGAAVNMFEATIGLALVLVCNKVANKVAGLGLW